MLDNLVSVCILVYFVDMLICSAIADDHTRHVRDVVVRLSKAKFHIECKGCALFLPEVKFLVYVVSDDRMQVSPGIVVQPCRISLCHPNFLIQKLF